MPVSNKYLRALIFSPLAVLLAAGLSAPLATAQDGKTRRTEVYVAVGAKLLQYDIDPASGAMKQQSSVTLPEYVQEAWPSPSRKFLYVTWSDRDDSNPAVPATRNGVSTFRIDPGTGALTLQGEPLKLPYRSIYITTDIDGTHLLTAHNDPSALIVHRILPDGTVGTEVAQAGKLDFGIYAHQVRVDPSNQAVFLVTRGNGPTAKTPEDPGAIRVFNYQNGILTGKQTVAPNGGYNYQIRHLDFHPSGKWVYATLERQNKLHVYSRAADGTLSSEPIFAKDTLADPAKAGKGQAASSIHMHPNGRFVYVANRARDTAPFEGKQVFTGGENTIAVFSINQDTGEPTLIQSEDTRGFSPRTFAIDASGRVLVVANQISEAVRDGSSVRTVPASVAVFRIRGDGKLEFVHQYDFETGGAVTAFWTGIILLP